jgi:CHASE2 domain-containing sensor protein/predicted Ser/Thr protein kinase
MSYCINPICDQRQNPDHLDFCQACGSSLVINERYRLLNPLYELNVQHPTEVFEVDNLGTRKVLKILKSDRHRLIELFQQEAQILKQLSYLPVPRLDSYFTYPLKNCFNNLDLHCLVMEKVEGENLQQWLANNGPIAESLAREWLGQLIAILEEIHKEEILHRDIKPANIMLTPRGKLILIDFGTARKITNTYIYKLPESELTRVYSSGYTAPEQLSGQAFRQSDFFALGRTFIHLLTGIHPDNLPKDPLTGELDWRSEAPQISSRLADWLDNSIVPSPEQRSMQSKSILKKSTFVSQTVSNVSSIGYPQIEIEQRMKGIWQSLARVILISTVSALLVMGIRYTGMLQPMELHAFDRLMQMRPIETLDSRLLLVTIDDSDIQYQNQKQMQMRWSLADEALLNLLKKLDEFQPRAIGLDIYRDFPVDTNYPELGDRLQRDSRLLTICKTAASVDGAPDSVPPPPEAPSESVSFSDFVADDDEHVRRQLLQLNPSATSACSVEYSFGLQLAFKYLQAEGISTKLTPEAHLQLGETIFQPLTAHSSGYQGIDASGYQIPLNYRSLPSPMDIAETVSLQDILENKLDSRLLNLLRDRIVIIGVTASSINDYWKTPYQKQIPGVFLQAQMVSQILSAVLEKRPQIWWLPTWIEAIWIWGWSLVAGMIVWQIRKPLFVGVAIALTTLLLFGICLTIFKSAGWIPLVPTVLSLTITVILVVFFKQSSVLANPRKFKKL